MSLFKTLKEQAKEKFRQSKLEMQKKARAEKAFKDNVAMKVKAAERRAYEKQALKEASTIGTNKAMADFEKKANNMSSEKKKVITIGGKPIN